MVEAPENSGPGANGADSGSPLKIALFSLGNMCAHVECAEALLGMGLLDSLRCLGTSTDPTVLKYVARIQVGPCPA